MDRFIGSVWPDPDVVYVRDGACRIPADDDMGITLKGAWRGDVTTEQVVIEVDVIQ